MLPVPTFYISAKRWSMATMKKSGRTAAFVYQVYY